MNKAVLISIHPKWCALIANGNKTIEVRKTRPKIETPFKCYIYETKGKTEYPTFIDEEGHEIFDGKGKVIGEFICDWIKEFGFSPYNHGEYIGIDNISDESCLFFEDLFEYVGEGFGYGWHISDLVMYDKLKELSDLVAPCDHTFDEVLCSRCNRFDNGKCSGKLRRAPQSWCYVEEAMES